jgi:hypothetical protein
MILKVKSRNFIYLLTAQIAAISLGFCFCVNRRLQPSKSDNNIKNQHPARDNRFGNKTNSLIDTFNLLIAEIQPVSDQHG